MVSLSTLCYIEKDDQYLMLHRTVKKNDINKDKWIGVGGHFEKGESPEECLLREVKEETGYTLTSWKYRGIVIPCDEGELEWVEKKKIQELDIWEGDKIFFRLLEEGHPFFSLKLVYDAKGTLLYAALDGRQMELDAQTDR